MATKTLLEKIDALPPHKQAEIEDFVDRLAESNDTSSANRPAKAFPDKLLHRINADREALFKEQGLFETLPLIREFRETGGR